MGENYNNTLLKYDKNTRWCQGWHFLSNSLPLDLSL